MQSRGHCAEGTANLKSEIQNPASDLEDRHCKYYSILKLEAPLALLWIMIRGRLGLRLVTARASPRVGGFYGTRT